MCQNALPFHVCALVASLVLVEPVAPEAAEGHDASWDIHISGLEAHHAWFGVSTAKAVT